MIVRDILSPGKNAHCVFGSLLRECISAPLTVLVFPSPPSAQCGFVSVCDAYLPSSSCLSRCCTHSFHLSDACCSPQPRPPIRGPLLTQLSLAFLLTDLALTP